MARKLDDVLRDHGCDMDVAVFRELLKGRLADDYPGWNDEELMHRPQEALRYCQAIRQAARCFDLPDELILRTLSNMRKHPG
jgi:hypothetical protein